MSYNVKLTEKCEKTGGVDDYEEYREHGKPNTPVEDETLRHFLAMAQKEGLVESFSKKEYMTLEA